MNRSSLAHLKAAALLSLLIAPIALKAASVEYIGAPSSDWADPLSWSGAAPGNSDTALLGNNSGTPSRITTGFHLGGIVFAATAAKTVTIESGAQLVLYGTGGPTRTLISNLANQSLTLSGQGQVVLASSGVIQVGVSNRSVSINSAIAETGGSHGFIKTGAGTLNLFNATGSTFSGGITLREGTLTTNVSSSGSANAPTQGPLGTGVLTLEGGVFRYTGSSTGVFHNAISITGDITLGDSASDRRSFTFTGDVDLNGEQRNLNVALHDPNSAVRNIQFTGSMANGGLTKSGVGILRLTGENNYTGSTLITEGTLSLAGGGAIASSHEIRIEEEATFEVMNNYALAHGQHLVGSGRVIGNFSIGSGTVHSGENGEVLTLEANSVFDGGVLELGLQDDGLASLLLSGADVHITGNNSGSVKIILSDLGSIDAPGTYLLISTTQTSHATFTDWEADAFTLDPMGGDWIGSLRMEDRNLYLDVAAIPEPGSLTLIGVGLLYIGCTVRRRHNP